MVIASLIRKVFFSVITILFATNSFSADLVRIYALAEKNDPVYQQEISTHRAILESKPQAWSQLLPSLDISANTRRNAQDITTSGSSIGADGEIDFNSHGYSLNLINYFQVMYQIVFRFYVNFLGCSPPLVLTAFVKLVYYERKCSGYLSCATLLRSTFFVILRL